MGLLTLWKNFLPWTQAVIVAQLIARARSPWMQAFWYLVFGATNVAFFLTCYYLTADHFSYKKTTSTRLFHEREAAFPALTFCNLNPFKNTMVERSPELTNLLAAYVYVVKLRQAKLSSGTTAAARARTSSAPKDHARMKRQAGGTNGAPQSYNVTSFSNGTVSVQVEACKAGNLPKRFTLANATTEMATNLNGCFCKVADVTESIDHNVRDCD